MKRLVYVLFLTAYISSFSQNFTVKNIPQELLKNTNSVVVEEKVTVLVDGIKKIETNYHGVITVLNKNGLATDRINLIRFKRHLHGFCSHSITF